MYGKSYQIKKKPLIPQKWIPVPIAVAVALLGVLFVAIASKIEYISIVTGAFTVIVAAVIVTLTLIGKRTDTRTFVLKLVSAGALLVAGVLIMVFMKSVAGTVCAVFSCVIATDAVVKLTLSLNSKKYTKVSKIIAASIAAVTLILAFSMIRLTPSEINDKEMSTCAVVIGITAIIDAIGTFIIPFLKRELQGVDDMTDDERRALGLKTSDEMEGTDAKPKKSPSAKASSAPKKDVSAPFEKEFEPLEGIADVYGAAIPEAPQVSETKKEPSDPDVENALPEEEEKKKATKNIAPRVKKTEKKGASAGAADSSDLQTLAEPKIVERPVWAQIKYDIVMTDAGGGSLAVIEAIRDVVGLTREEAEKAVKSLPTVLKRSVKPEEARMMVLALMEAGVEAEMRKIEPKN